MDKMELQSGDVLRVEGPVVLEVRGGKTKIVGESYGGRRKISVPKAISVPLEAETSVKITYKKGEEGKLEKLSGQTIPPEWNSVVDEIIYEEPDEVMIFGETDTGKTFFSTYLANKMLESGIAPAIVDTDTGQSDIGPPGTIGLGVPNSAVALLSEVRARNSYFIGSMSPSGHIPEFLVGMKRMTELGLKEADLVIVDTPGWVTGRGRKLQYLGAELLGPDLAIGLQRESELEHLLKIIAGEVQRIPASENVRARTAHERSTLRRESLAQYFKQSKELSLGLDEVRLERCYLGTGIEVDPRSLDIAGIVYAEKTRKRMTVVSEQSLMKEEIQNLERKFKKVNLLEKGDEKYVFVSMIDEDGNMMGVGSIEEIDYTSRKIKIITPVMDGKKVAGIQFGSMRTTPSGQEIGTLGPGAF